MINAFRFDGNSSLTEEDEFERIVQNALISNNNRDYGIDIEPDEGRKRKILGCFSFDYGKVCVDATKLRELWFPINENKYDIFISHSHNDIELVKRLKEYLSYKFSINCFIDSAIWGDFTYIKDYISKNYRQYNYEKAIENVFMLLTTALLNQINYSKFVFFFETNNFIKELNSNMVTNSPWIFFEIEACKNILKHKEYFNKIACVESKQQKPLIEFDYDVSKTIGQYRMIGYRKIDEIYNDCKIQPECHRRKSFISRLMVLS